MATLATELPVVRTEVRGAVSRLWSVAGGEVVISGPAGTGKTRSILEWIHQRCGQERLRVLMLRKTLESLKTSALVTYQEQVLYDFDGRASLADGVSYFGGNAIIPAQFTYEGTDSKILLGGMDRPSKVLSTEYDIIYVNEATELTLDQWELLGGRTDRPRIGEQRPQSLLLGDCNPDAPTHWIKLRADEGKLRLWPTTHCDNPAMWDKHVQQWTPAGQRYLERLRGFTGVRRLRMLLGVWAAAEGQVYDAWRDITHVASAEDVAAFLERRPWFFGAADWGWANPGVLQVYGVDRDGRMLMVAEHYHTHRTVEGWWAPRAVELSRRFGFNDWVCDPAEPQNIELFKRAGLNARGAINDLLPGITAVQNRLGVANGRPRLMIAENALQERDEELVAAKLPCSTLQEIPEYVWAKDAAGRPLTKERPVDRNNHGMDTMRYAVAHLDLQGGVVRPLDPRLVASWGNGAGTGWGRA